MPHVPRFGEGGESSGALATTMSEDLSTKNLSTRRNFLASAGLALSAWVGDTLLESRRKRLPSLLRPPGARSESDFLASCTRCGLCVEACPTKVLIMAGPGDGLAVGTPYAEVRDQPCNLCQGYDSLRCIDVCPTDALSPVESPRQVAMGLAILDQDSCFAWQGISCRACWHACPFPTEAITFDARGRALIVEDACVGCGLCVHACLTDPSSLKIIPQEERQLSA